MRWAGSKPAGNNAINGFGSKNYKQKAKIDWTKPECLPQEVKDSFKKAWKDSGYGFKDNSEYSFAIAQDAKTKSLTATEPQSTHEYSAGNIPNVSGIMAGAHSHGPGDLPGLSETDRDTAQKAGIAMYVMSREGGLVLYDPANKDTQKDRRDLKLDQHYYGIEVGKVLGKDAFWDKPCKK